MKDVTPSSAQKEVESNVIGKPRADETKDEKDKGMLDCFNCC
jgi:hypothetical protein